MRPRPPLTIRPSFVSNETSFAVVGVTGRKFIERIIPRCRESRLGHTAIVPIDEVERVVRALATADGANDEDNDATGEQEDEGPASVEAVLARLGKVRTA